MNERSLFLAAVDIPDPAERSAYLARACAGDEALQARVEVLVQSHREAGSYLGTPVLAQRGRPAAEERTEAIGDAHPRTQDPDETQAEPTPAGTSSDDALRFLAPGRKPGSIGRLAHYEVQEVLGQGGFGIVLKAFDEKLHRVVAIKLLAPSLAAGGTARQRFVREARVAAAVRHEHIVVIHAVDEDPLPYLVMECIVGQTLQEKIDRGGQLDVKEVLRIGHQVAAGLAAAHTQGLVHRDIKPANILLENGIERVKITDFGLAKVADDASMTQSGVIAGTPMYMAPEQALGQSVDHRADQFSLGTMLYTMCTGRPPFRAPSTLAVLKRVCEDTPRPVAEINPEIPEWLEAVISRQMAKKPEDRYQSTQEVADLLAEGLADMQGRGRVRQAGGPSRGKTTALAPRREKPAAEVGRRSRLRWVMAVGLLALTGLVGSTIAYLNWRRGHAPEPIPEVTGPVPGPVEKKPWVSLFNGKDLTGWRSDRPGSWTVEDGAVIGRTGDGAAHLTTERDDYTDFQLRAEVKVSGDSDSGVWLRLQPDRDGYEVQIQNTGNNLKTGSLCARTTANGKPTWNWLVNSKESPVPPDTWFTLEVAAHGPNLKIAVNGRQVAQATDHSHRSGAVALEVYRGIKEAPGQSVVHFRKIEIMELSPALTIAGDDTAAGHILSSDEYEWTEPVNFGPKINSAGADGSPWVSANGLTMLFSSTRPGGLGAYDIWQCTRSSVDEDWSAPVNLGEPINSKAFEGQATMSADGRTLVFTATRPGGEGAMDLWMATRKSKDAAWENPVNLGSAVNSATNDTMPILSDDNLQLFFQSNRDGKFRCWTSQRESVNSAWSRAELFCDHQGSSFHPLDSGKAVLVSQPTEISLARWNAGERRWGTPVPLPAPINDGSKNSNAFFCRLTNTLYFQSDRPGGQGETDLWMSRRVKKRSADEITLLRKLAGQTKRPTGLQFLNHGRHALSSSADGALRVWNFETGELERSIEDPGVRTTSNLALSPDGRIAVTSEYDQGAKIRVWDLRAGKLVHTIERGESAVFSAVFLPGTSRFVVGSYDGRLQAFEAETAKPVGEPVTIALAKAMVATPGGRVVVGTGPGVVHVVDVSTGKTVQRLAGHHGPTGAVAASTDGRWVAAGSEDGVVSLWDAETGEHRARLKGHEGEVQSLVFTPDGEHLLSGAMDRTLRVWSCTKHQEVARLETRTRVSLKLAVSPDGRTVLAGGGEWFDLDAKKWASDGDYDLRLWQLPESVWPKKNDITLAGKLTGHTYSGGGHNALAVSSDGRYMLSCGGQKVLYWDLAQRKLLRTLVGPKVTVSVVALSPDGKHAAAVTASGEVFIWNLKTGESTHVAPIGGKHSPAIAFSPDSCLLVSATEKGEAFAWNVQTGEKIAKHNFEGYWWDCLVMADNETVLACVSSQVRSWNLKTGKVDPIITNRGVNGVSLTLSADEKTLLVGTKAFGADAGKANPQDFVVQVWNTADWREVQRFSGHTSSVSSVEFLQGERYILSGGTDGRIIIWDRQTGKEVTRKEGLGHLANSVRPILGGRQAVSFGAFFDKDGVNPREKDYDIRLWNLPRSLWAPLTEVAPAPRRKP